MSVDGRFKAPANDFDAIVDLWLRELAGPFYPELVEVLSFDLPVVRREKEEEEK